MRLGVPAVQRRLVGGQHEYVIDRAGQVNKHHPLVHALSRTFRIMSIRHKVESGAPFHPNRDFRMNVVIEAGRLRDATTSEYHNKAILLDFTYADPHAGVHMRIDSADRDGSATSTSWARKRKYCARSGQVSFDEHSYKLATLAVESVGRLGKEGSELIDEVAASIVRGTSGSSLSGKVSARNASSSPSLRPLRSRFRAE